jgi:hypothetical protein
MPLPLVVEPQHNDSQVLMLFGGMLWPLVLSSGIAKIYSGPTDGAHWKDFSRKPVRRKA